MHAWLPLLFFLPTPASAAPPQHKVDVRIAGPLAMVEVWRSLDVKSSAGDRPSETVLDLALPEGAALLDWEVIDRGKRTRLSRLSPGQVSAGLTAALRLRQMSLATAPIEEGTDYRVHVAPIADGGTALLHYRYSAIIACSEGRLVLRMPGSLEANPFPAEVTVRFDPLPDGRAIAEASVASTAVPLRRPSRRLLAHGTAPARDAWEIGWRYAAMIENFPGHVLAAAGDGLARASFATVGAVCRVDRSAKLEAPARVILLVDRSRSVGPGGMSAERALARALMEALPPSVTFNAVLFGSEAAPVFALPRLATREALDVFTAAADPHGLENGTDVTRALARARTLIDGEQSDSTGCTWVVLITDGALPTSQTFARMRGALAGAHDERVKVLVLFARQHGDDEVPAPAIAEYASFVRKFGGLVHAIPSGDAAESAHAIVDAMARGGDLLDVRLDNAKLADVLLPGQGAHVWFADSTRPARRVRFVARGMDGDVHAETNPVVPDRQWVVPILEDYSHGAWSGATSSLAIAILPVRPGLPAAKNVDDVVHGQMDPTVLRNTLALAFMPRARACYLSRRVARAGDAYLRGRMRLQLTLERGELHDAVIRQSTLNNPAVETCVRDAAFAIEYPRPEHRDAPTVANLNLVFRPHTAEETAPDASAQNREIDRELDVILGPVTFPADAKDLIPDDAPNKSPSP